MGGAVDWSVDWSAGWNAGLSVLVGGLCSDDWDHQAAEHSNAVYSSLKCQYPFQYIWPNKLLFASAAPVQWRGADLSGLAGREERDAALTLHTTPTPD